MGMITFIKSVSIDKNPTLNLLVKFNDMIRYRIKLPYQRSTELISKKNWIITKLLTF